ncbi:DUF6054 family protein [uncultured Clostridium sp.]|uniref:DUF6054 family protein n=1 Tax=uncultured Clostridium sp. TaxID=59620 RepID=UPI0028E37BCD|nr:DUF6054 family protein [uncultured Clostridium sp.]
MDKYNFIVNLTPAEVMSKVKKEESADLIHEEFHDIGNDRYYGTLIFEKYFMRVSSRVALIVLVNNLNGKTKVTTVATGSSQGRFFSFDWGAADDFAYSVKIILNDFITE